MSNGKAGTSNRIAQCVACAIGFLVGGLTGLICGQFFQNETVVVVLYVLGAIVGAVAGIKLFNDRLGRTGVEETKVMDDLNDG